MKQSLYFLFFIATLCGAQNTTYQSEISAHRKELNAFYNNKQKSPLTSKEIKKFKGLPFFKTDQKYRVKAKLTYTFNSPITFIKNTDGQTEAYQQYALASFTIDGKKLRLSIYQSKSLQNKRGYENYLFIPFTDATNGKTTYSGGRYIDTTIPEEPTGYITLDFNKAYNPYCAYNSKYTCPVPPKNNHLNIEILAGVKH